MAVRQGLLGAILLSRLILALSVYNFLHQLLKCANALYALQVFHGGPSTSLTIWLLYRADTSRQLLAHAHGILFQLCKGGIAAIAKLGRDRSAVASRFGQLCFLLRQSVGRCVQKCVLEERRLCIVSCQPSVHASKAQH